MKSAAEIVGEFDRQLGPLSEIDVFSKLEVIAKDKASVSNFDEMTFRSELIAFAFDEDYSWDRWNDGGWKTYFGPLAVMNTQQDGSGSVIICPHISEVTSETIDYWFARASKCSHPVIKVRYLSIIWDFYKHAKKANPPINVAHELIDTVIVMAEQRKHKYEIEELNKLKYALKIAISIKDQTRVGAVKDAILKYDKDVVKGDTAAGAWSVPFDHLLTNKKVLLFDAEINEILSRLEGRLDRLSACKGEDIQSLSPIVHAVKRLASFYKNKNMKAEQDTALRKYFEAVYKKAALGSPIQQCAWLGEAIKIAKEYNMKDEENKLILLLQDASSNLHKDMKKISVNIPFDKEKMDDYVTSMVAGTLNDCLQRLAFSWLSPYQEVEKLVKELAKQNPMTHIFPIPLSDPSGRQVAIIRPVNEDIVDHVYWQAAKNMVFKAELGVTREIISKIFTADEINEELLLDYLYQSPLFLEENKEIIKEGLESYINQKPISAIHILVPQLESSLRAVLEIKNQKIYKQNRKGDGYNLKILDDLLREEAIIEVLGEDVCFNLKVLLTDQRGLCMRHYSCHGLYHSKDYVMARADLIFQALLVLAQVKQI